MTNRFDPVSEAIRFTTRSWASHAELVDLDKCVTLGARARSLRYPGGVQIRDCQYDHYSRCERFVLNSPQSPKLLELAWGWLCGKIGTPYNYAGIVGIASDLTIENPAAMDCSHAMYACTWLGADFPLLSTRPSNLPWRITPRDLLLSRQLVYLP